MATFFRNKVIKNVGTKPVEILETTPTNRATVIGLSITNLSADFVYINVYVEDDTSVSGFFLKDTILPANTSLRALSAGEKLILAPSNQLYLVSDTTEAFDAVISYVNIV